MGLNDTVRADRIHIAFFGKRNAGKSSLVNAVTDQEISVVSDTKGTTTDPVTKEMIRQYVREVPGYLREMGYELYRKAYRE